MFGVFLGVLSLWCLVVWVVLLVMRARVGAACCAVVCAMLVFVMVFQGKERRTITFKVGRIGRTNDWIDSRTNNWIGSRTNDWIGIRPADKPWLEFTGRPESGSELPYTAPGDEVTLTYVESDGLKQIVGFDNLAIDNVPAAKK